MVGAATVGATAALGGYSLLEAKWCQVNRHRIPVAGLPAGFAGFAIALLSDVHHGPFVPLAYVEHVVSLANALHPDLVCLAGDFVHHGARYIEPVWEVLRELRGAEGVVAVLGNHDHWEGASATRRALAAARVTELHNGGEWLRRGGARLRIAGVGDLLEDVQDVAGAVGDATVDDATVLLCHEPDLAEGLNDPRVKLQLSGHTHGGQVCLPGYGPLVVPSRYGTKYARGLVQGRVAPVFVTCGVGTITPPVRLCCRPEVALLELVPAVVSGAAGERALAR
jgi:predicted MPP superfamily phosphohydrolase